MFKRRAATPLFTPPAFDFDSAQDDLDLRDARRRVLDGDWTAARAVIQAASGDSETRDRRIGILSGIAGVGDWLATWIKADPNDPVAAIMTAALAAGRAGDARGSASAAKTSPEQFAEFARLSVESEKAARHAIALGPAEPYAWNLLMDSYMADGHHHQADFAEALAEGLRRDPHNFELHLSAVTFYCAKWYGSHQQMFTAARAAAAAAPVGSSTAMVPFLAHFEYAMREFSWDKRTDESRAACGQYFQRADVRYELDMAVAKWRAGGPRRLGRSMTGRHWQLLAAVLSGRRDEARAVYAEIGTNVGTSVAWGYFWRNTNTGYLAGWEWAFNGR